MRKIYALVAALGVAAFGCGDSGSGGSGASGGGDSGGSGGGDGGGGGINPNGGNGGGGPLDCAGLLDDGTGDTCLVCIEDSCCPELDACDNDSACNACLNDPNADPDACGADPLLGALLDCRDASCSVECTPVDACNPVTNEGCTGAGEACDLSSGGNYVCFPPPNDTALCQACDNGAGPFCVPGATCIPETNQCGRFCCADGDCGTGVCNFDIYMDPEVGICVTAAGAITPSCDAPATSPSGGTCGAF